MLHTSLRSLMRRALLSALSVLTVTLAGCDETDLVAVRVRLNRDLSGTVVSSSLAIPVDDGLVQQATLGARWESRVHVVCAAGSFESLNDLKVADLGFVAGEGSGNLMYAQLTVPRGPQARWPLSMVPLTPDERVVAATALDPTGKVRSVGTTLKFEIELPTPVVGNGLTNRARGTKASADGQTATLLIPLEVAVSAGEPMVWHITWQK